MREAARRVAAACAAALVGACASLPAPIPDQVAAFELSGRVAVRYGAEAASGRAEWRHSPAADDMVISTPLGQGIACATRAGSPSSRAAATSSRS